MLGPTGIFFFPFSHFFKYYLLLFSHQKKKKKKGKKRGGKRGEKGEKKEDFAVARWTGNSLFFMDSLIMLVSDLPTCLSQ